MENEIELLSLFTTDGDNKRISHDYLDNPFKDFNIIISLVEKIESLNYSTDLKYIAGLGHYFIIYSVGVEVIRLRPYETKIKALYKGVIEFVNYYNKLT